VRQLDGDSSTESEITDDEQPARRDKRRYSLYINATGIPDKDLYPLTGDAVPLKVLIDSGSSTNVMGKHDWERLKDQGIETKTARSMTGELRPYGEGPPITIIGRFKADVRLVSGLTQTVKFYVVEGNGVPVLGKKSATEMGLLRLATVNALTAEDIVKK